MLLPWNRFPQWKVWNVPSVANCCPRSYVSYIVLARRFVPRSSNNSGKRVKMITSVCVFVMWNGKVVVVKGHRIEYFCIIDDNYSHIWSAACSHNNNSITQGCHFSDWLLHKVTKGSGASRVTWSGRLFLGIELVSLLIHWSVMQMFLWTLHITEKKAQRKGWLCPKPNKIKPDHSWPKSFIVDVYCLDKVDILYF